MNYDPDKVDEATITPPAFSRSSATIRTGAESAFIKEQFAVGRSGRTLISEIAAKRGPQLSHKRGARLEAGDNALVGPPIT